tara:strand:- start:11 stop:355 length:345 start_codon:yes stop_codon:yes gene_type:complete
MAIKVNGTTVIDDSRNLTSVGGLKTVGGTSILGSGNIDAGAPTTLNSVGTYAAMQFGGVVIQPGTATAASSYICQYISCGDRFSFPSSGTISGTWRCMGYNNGSYGGTVFVRIS